MSMALNSQICISLLIILNLEKPTTGIPFDLEPCGYTKGCALIPPTCPDRYECIFLFSYTNNEDNLEMEIYAKLSKANGYVAIGFSDDAWMGEDYVVFCGTSEESTDVVAGLTFNGKDYLNKLITNYTMELLDHSVENGFLYCKLRHKWATTIEKYDLLGTYYVLMATGLYTDGKVHYHVLNRWVSDYVSLTAYDAVKGQVHELPLDPMYDWDDGYDSCHMKNLIGNNLFFTKSVFFYSKFTLYNLL
ncbi:DOMON domain protein [Dictyocaulus viviparus]|uniref:DOMON domain protein n=1 Tax=Dictyocaulus viviparus TaxID=29172 RepID=A0A0D8XWH6_DICVI|nr:DOMON domain protein [Dictyocaulus viviparus]